MPLNYLVPQKHADIGNAVCHRCSWRAQLMHLSFQTCRHSSLTGMHMSGMHIHRLPLRAACTNAMRISMHYPGLLPYATYLYPLHCTRHTFMDHQALVVLQQVYILPLAKEQTS